jgi:hypothetical protein
VYALDGKTVRGVRKKDEEDREHLVSVYDVLQGKVLSQVPVGRRENKLSQAPKALEFVEISQKVVTADAMHTQTTSAAQFIDQGGDYLFPVKENQPHLFQLAWPRSGLSPRTPISMVTQRTLPPQIVRGRIRNHQPLIHPSHPRSPAKNPPYPLGN